MQKYYEKQTEQRGKRPNYSNKCSMPTYRYWVRPSVEDGCHAYFLTRYHLVPNVALYTD